MTDFKSERHAALSRRWPNNPVRIAYRRPQPIPTRRPPWREILAAVALVAVFAGLGILLAWRG